jgi:hypothetical protein
MVIAAYLNRESSDLLSSLERVVSDWAFLSVELLGDPAEVPPALPLERRVILDGPQPAVLVLRGSYGLGLELARLVRGMPAASLPAAEAAFTELASLLAEDWIHKTRATEGQNYSARAPQVSRREEWPEGQPGGSFAATIRGFAVEARIWRPSLVG